MCRRLLSLALFCTWMVTLGAAAAQSSKDAAESSSPKPLVMLMVIGSDSPSFVLYDDGQVVYRDVNEAQEYEFMSVQLDDDQLADLLDEFAIGDDFFALDDYYEVTGWTDQPTHTITVPGEAGEFKTVSVYGDPEAAEENTPAPEAFIPLFNQLFAYDNPDAETWQPERVEIMLWAFDTNDALQWSSDFPGLDSPYAVQRDDQYSIFLTQEQFAELSDQLGDNPAVEVGGQTWAVSGRNPFPHEAMWQAMLEQVAAEDEADS